MRNEKKILFESCKIVQSLITKLYEKAPDNVTFEQAGMRNGLEVVADYLKHSEVEIALEHLLYMINESDITCPSDVKENLSKITKKYKLEDIGSS